MLVLVGCEESQEICKAFREKGHEAYSCDIQDCSGGHPEWHLKIDVLEAIKLKDWDLGIFNVPCTFFSRAAGKVCHLPERIKKRDEIYKLFLSIWNCKIKKVAIENPSGWLCTNFQKPSQRFHPWHFGAKEMKETCLWLRGLPVLQTDPFIVANPHLYKPKPISSRLGKDGKMKNKYFVSKCKTAKERSKTFPEVAKAMAEQWGN